LIEARGAKRVGRNGARAAGALAITPFTFVARFVADQAGRDIRGFFFDGASGKRCS
jgi:hypothetical protein